MIIFQDRFHPLSRVASMALRHPQRNKTFNSAENMFVNTYCSEQTGVRGTNGVQYVIKTASLLMKLVNRRMHGLTVELMLASISS